MTPHMIPIETRSVKFRLWFKLSVEKVVE